MIQLLICLLSVLSCAGVAAILRAPDLPHERPIPAPIVMFPALDEGYHDTRGLV